MGAWFRRFAKDQRGTSFEGIALSVSIIAVAFVASADMLDYVTKPRGELTTTAALAKRPIPATTSPADLDDTPTASLPHLVSRSVLDPCTGRVK